MRVKKCINIFVVRKRRWWIIVSDGNIMRESLRGLVKDLKKECEEFIGIANQLEQGDLTEDEVEEWLGEIMTSAASLNIYSENIRNELDRSEIG